MKSNFPTLLGQQDFMSSNWDMVKSAKLEPLTDEQIETNRKYASISMRMITEYCPGDEPIKVNSYIYNKIKRTLIKREIGEPKFISWDLGSEDKTTFWYSSPVEDNILNNLIDVMPKVYTK